MSKKAISAPTAQGRPSEFSEDVLALIIKEYQAGKSLYAISEMKGMPEYTTILKWRFTRPDFFQILKGCEEDERRRARAELREVADRARQTVAIMTPEELMGSPALVNAAINSLDKLNKSPGIEGEPPAVQEDAQQNMRQMFDQLHPVTQDKIRQALLEDRRMRGEEEEDEA